MTKNHGSGLRTKVAPRVGLLKNYKRNQNHEDIIDYSSYADNLSSSEIKAWKNSGLNGIRTHDLGDTGAVLCQLSYQANWELVTSWVTNIPVEGEEYKWIYEISYIWTAEKDMKTWFIITVICEIKAWKKFRPQRDQSCLHIFLRNSDMRSFISFICKAKSDFTKNSVFNSCFAGNYLGLEAKLI